MTRNTTFGKHAFSRNRWSVGEQGVEQGAVVQRSEREQRAAAARTAKFKASRVKAQLRPVLMLQNPHCHDCGIRLQMIDNSGANYANVILAESVLCCGSCSQQRGKVPKIGAASDVAFGAGLFVESEVPSC